VKRSTVRTDAHTRPSESELATATSAGRSALTRTVATVLKRHIDRARASIDGFDVVFGLLPGLTGYAAVTVWTQMLIRGVRGEQDEADEWRLIAASAAYIATRSLASASRVRGDVSMHASVAEMRELLREAARDAEQRDGRAAAMEARLYRINVRMAWVAGLTLAAAIVTLGVTIAMG
jgi:hypothetical protein